MEERVDYLIKLGEALYKFYDGQTLTLEELAQIATSSNDDKIMGLDLNATKRLKMRNDRSLDNFVNNNNSLKIMSFNRTKR